MWARRVRHFSPGTRQLLLDKLDDQGMGISRDRAFLIASLRRAAGEFCTLVEAHGG
jgi:hypothetical protein